MIQRQIYVRQRLGLDALRRIHHKDCAVTGCQTAAHLIVKIHMPGRVDQIEHILIAILGIVDNTHRLGLDRDTALPLQLHVVQHLRLHLPAGQQSRLFYDSVRQRRFTVIDMRYDTKIPDLTLVYGCHNILPHNLFYLPFCLIAFLPAPSRQLCHSFPAPKYAGNGMHTSGDTENSISNHRNAVYSSRRKFSRILYSFMTGWRVPAISASVLLRSGPDPAHGPAVHRRSSSLPPCCSVRPSR